MQFQSQSCHLHSHLRAGQGQIFGRKGQTQTVGEDQAFIVQKGQKRPGAHSLGAQQAAERAAARRADTA
jgi:hypothetical protein